MELRGCSSSNLQLSVLGLGCWSFGGGEYWGPQEERDERDVVAAALACGVNYFDTAAMYNDGRSEEALGRALSGRRGEAIVGTKVMPDRCASPEALRSACEESLRRLGTDYIDIYMVHWPMDDSSAQDAFDALTRLREAGLVRAIGLSNHGIHQMTTALATGACIEFNQLCYNLLSRAIEVELMPFCAQHGIGILTYMPLAQGLLAGCYASPDEVPAPFARTRHFRGDRPGVRHSEPGAEAETFAALAALRDVAQVEGLPLPVLALAWAKSRPEVTTVLLGARTPAQLNEDLSAFEMALREDLVKQLNTITQPLLDRLGSNPDYYETAAKSRIR